MAKWSIVILALVGCTVAEPPVGYSYSAPSFGGGHGSAFSSGGHYHSVPIGHQTSEGYHVDPYLLQKIKHIILKDEIQNQAYESSYSSGGHGHGHGHGISSSYGPPAPVYGVPQDRIVGIELDHIQQGIQVAQYHQAEEGYAGGYSGHSGYSGHGGYSGGGDYSGPSISYATIGVPSGSYGIPSPSSSYGSPHH